MISPDSTGMTAYAFKTPDCIRYIAGGLKTFMDDFYAHEVRKRLTVKPYALFYSHGGGVRVKYALRIFRRVGTRAREPVGCYREPDRKTLEKLKTLDAEIAEDVAD